MIRKNFLVKMLVIFIIICVLIANFSIVSSYNLINDKKIVERDINNFLFSTKVKTYMRLLKTPSITAAVIKNDSIVWTNAYGFSNFYIRQKANINSIYVVGSISKTITAAAIMKIIENKSYNITLDDNVNYWLPFNLENPNYPDINITFRMLLAHQSSLTDSITDIFYYLPLIEDKVQWLKDRITPDGKYYDGSCWKNYPPGKEHNYSNIGFILLSYLVENITKMNFNDFCKINIFKPLNMKNTSFHNEGLNKKQFARPYFPISNFIHIPIHHYDTECVCGCAGLRTTCIDLAKFLILHMNKGVYNGVRILNETTIEEMHRVQYPCEPEKKWFFGGNISAGLGWSHICRNGIHWQGYNGGAVGFSCNMLINSDENTGIIMLCNKHTYRSVGPYSQIRFDWYQNLAKLLLTKSNDI